MRTSPLLAALAAAATLSAVAAPAVAAPTAHPFTVAQLESTQQSLNTRLRHPATGIAGWGVDPASGRVVISVVAGNASAAQAARTAARGLVGTTIVTVKEQPRLFYNVVGGQAITNASGRCSIGFSAKNSAGAKFVITAGHCTVTGSPWYGYNGVTMGQVSRTNFPGDDYGSIAVTSSSWTLTSQVQGTASVQGSTEALVGASVCRSGSTTGYHCGVIQAKNQTVVYTGNHTVYGLTKTNVCAEPGDSGGSFVSGRQAQGMTSGGSGDCTHGGTTYFQPVKEALSTYGLTLVTG